jgi:hypothetical protein
MARGNFRDEFSMRARKIKRPDFVSTLGLRVCLLTSAAVIVLAGVPGSGNFLRPSIIDQAKPLQYDVGVINVEVPVRVYDGDSFVENLTIDDFEIYEDGVPQKLEAIYLIKNAAMARQEGTMSLTPKTGRSFFLFFQVYTHNPRTDDAIDYFVRDVLKPEDDLTIVTSVKPYHLKRARLEGASRDGIGQQLAELVRRDTLVGNTEYRTILDELKRMISGGTLDTAGGRDPDLGLFGEGSWQEFLMNYRDLRERLDKIRSFDGERLLSFADYLKTKEGQKIVLFFYQREYLPMIDRKKYIGRFENAEDFLVEQSFHDLFDVYKRDSKIELDRIKKTFADASISVHFLFITERPEHIAGLSDAAMEEHSEDVYSPLLEMVKATGGLAASSSNPSSLMKKAGAASENYYLLYYKPSASKADGKFRQIKVVVKNRPYRILHRAGYFSK